MKEKMGLCVKERDKCRERERQTDREMNGGDDYEDYDD